MTRKKNASPELLEQYCYEQDLAGLTDAEKVGITPGKRVIQEEVLQFTSAEKGTLQEVEEFVNGWMFQKTKEPMSSVGGITSHHVDLNAGYQVVRDFRTPKIKIDAFQCGNYVANLTESIYRIKKNSGAENGWERVGLLDRRNLHILIEDNPK